MANIELVIKIPEEDYESIKDDVKKFLLMPSHKVPVLYEAVNKGKLLPKGHGRIADMDEAIKCIKDVEGDDAIWAISLIEWACAKRTIIETDKVESEDKE